MADGDNVATGRHRSRYVEEEAERSGDERGGSDDDGGDSDDASSTDSRGNIKNLVAGSGDEGGEAQEVLQSDDERGDAPGQSDDERGDTRGDEDPSHVPTRHDDGEGGDSHDGDGEEEEEEEEEGGEDNDTERDYFTYNNLNNMQMSLRIFDGERKERLLTMTEDHGYMYCFLSRARSPALSEDAYKQILMLLHITGATLTPACAVETENLKPDYEKGENKGDMFVRCVRAKTELDVHPYDRDGRFLPTEYNRSVRLAAGAIPFDEVVDHRDGIAHTKSHEYITDVGEIIVCAVAAHGYDAQGTEVKTHIYWLVCLKTLKNYHFPDHIQAVLRDIDNGSRNLRRRFNLLGSSGDAVRNIINEVLRHHVNMLPSPQRYMRTQDGIKTPLMRFNVPGAPDSIEGMCNIMENFRGILWDMQGENILY